MSNGKEIKTKISSIQSTQKITSAMEMVASSKMKKAKINMEKIRPYFDKINTIVSHLASASPEFKHDFLETPKVENSKGIIIISTDRGLCGGLNNNLFKLVLLELNKNPKTDYKISVIGSKGVSFFTRINSNVISSTVGITNTPTFEQVSESILPLIKMYSDGEISELLIAGNNYISAVKQSPTIKAVLPLTPEENIDAKNYPWDYIYEPSPESTLDILLNRYVESYIYKTLIENIACEQSARMLSMKNATDNAGDMIDELNLIYNKERQAKITQEISEIINGASAI